MKVEDVKKLEEETAEVLEESYEFLVEMSAGDKQRLVKVHSAVEKLKREYDSLQKRYSDVENIKNDVETVGEVIAGISLLVKGIMHVKQQLDKVNKSSKGK